MPDTTILSLPEARALLRLSDENAARDTLLTDVVLPGVDELIESHVGAVVPRAHTFEVIRHGGASTILLPEPNVLSLTSGTLPNGDAVDVTSFVVEPGGVLRATVGHLPAGRWSLVAQVGREPIPHGIKMAAGEVLALAWETQRSQDPTPFLLPYRAEAWLAPHTNGATFA